MKKPTPLLPQPLKHIMVHKDNAAAPIITGRSGNFLSRLCTGLMPAIGNNRKASAIQPSDPPRKGFALCAVCWLMVWMVMVTGVAPLPAGIVAGEKATVALKVRASG